MWYMTVITTFRFISTTLIQANSPGNIDNRNRKLTRTTTRHKTFRNLCVAVRMNAKIYGKPDYERVDLFIIVHAIFLEMNLVFSSRKCKYLQMFPLETKVYNISSWPAARITLPTSLAPFSFKPLIACTTPLQTFHMETETFVQRIFKEQ